MTKKKSPDPESKSAQERLAGELKERYKQIAQRLVTVRKALRRSQDRVASDVFGRGKGTLGAWEKATREAGVVELGMLAQYYQVSCDYLILGGESEAHKEAARLVQLFVQLDPSERTKILGHAEYLHASHHEDGPAAPENSIPRAKSHSGGLR